LTYDPEPMALGEHKTHKKGHPLTNQGVSFFC
jgi:hypothetical protein